MKKVRMISIVVVLLILCFATSVYATYAYYVVSYAKIGNSNYSNIYGIESGPDNSYCELYGGDYGDGAVVNVYMDAQISSGAPIYMYGYSYSGYMSHVYVYMSSDNSNWYLVGSGYLDAYSYVGSTTPSYIYVGNAPITGRYIGISAYDGQGWSAKVLVDFIYTP
jgi:hypothetical protein